MALTSRSAQAATHNAVVTTDPEKHEVAASFDGMNLLSAKLTNAQPIHVAVSEISQSTSNALWITNTATPQPTLCQSLIR